MPLNRSAVTSLRFGLAAVTLWFAGSIQGAEIDQQREIFQSVYADVERGNWSAVEKLGSTEQQSLAQYPLWPDLRATWFRATIKTADHQAIDEFLDLYGVLKPAREVRYRYALHLAKTGDLSAYLQIYKQFYQGQDIARLDCIGLHAEIDAGEEKRVVNRAIELWMVSSSQVKECDPVFAFLHKQKLLGPTEYLKRYNLVIEAREFALAQWLGRSVSQGHVAVEPGMRSRKARSSGLGSFSCGAPWTGMVDQRFDHRLMGALAPEGARAYLVRSSMTWTSRPQ